MNSLLISILLVGLCTAYIEDTVKPALDNEPFILPPPMNISYGNFEAIIDPCNLEFIYNK